ncbi:AAA domain-containing protein [Fodinicola feengrottensis]|uniref:AAA domain-containing protein n=1 Tax=Fodinicola feengrottensis TaxID=435914 RepID=A0ABP4VC70_9ACTN
MPPERRNPPRLALTIKDLHRFTQELASGLGLRDFLLASRIRVRCVQVPVRDSDTAGEQNFMNSHIANDLAQVEKAVRAGDIGKGLATYLSDESSQNRVDVRADREAVVSEVQPNLIPGGRWPAATTKPLAMSQQFATNRILRELLDGAGIFAINGPPGTGKTTMLRDVLAAVVVERATKLAALARPSDGFTGVMAELPGFYRSGPAKVRGIRPDLTGFEIVVATAGNDAAKNVTAEIPGIGAVEGAESAALAADYFTDLASQVLDRDAWGLAAVPLGNMGNRHTFADKWWWGKKKKLPGQPPAASPATIGMLEMLQGIRKNPPGIQEWATAVGEFQAATTTVRELAAARQEVADQIARLPWYERGIRETEDRIRQREVACSRHEEDLRRAEATREGAQRAFDDVDREYQDWPNHRPGFWVSLSTWFRAGRDWSRRHAELAHLREKARKELDEKTAERGSHRSILSQVKQELAAEREKLGAARRRLSDAYDRISDAHRQWPQSVPHGNGVADDEKFQLCAPWADEEFTAARSQLFLAALRLHKAFLFQTERQARDNLAAIVSVIQGKIRLPAPALLAAWQTLFMVVPMISTTFASLPRLFADLGSESFGWLFIDEAGQATAQQAVGGLWRCRRAVIVGDPQQLEPIVTLPRPAQDALRDYYGVHEHWTPETASVQRTADRHARHGTALPEPGGGDPIWVGSPLRVHRRCDRPMFDISNTIAYGGDLMVYGTKIQGHFPGENCWFDVSGPAEGNWVPAEGEALASLLAELRRDGVKPDRIRVISPFRDAVRGSKEVVSRILGSEFAYQNVGTIHTVQGQEAAVVIMVLGSAPGNQGARQWASEKPNLLNVAVSRAKRRFYVIGDRENWKDLRFFDVLAATLPARRL